MVVLPGSVTELRGTGTDLENDPLTVGWSILSQPAGADAQLTSPNQGRCPVSGLSVAGDYVFRNQADDAIAARDWVKY